MALFKDHFLSPHDTFLMHIFILHSSGSPTQLITPQVIPLSNCIITSLSLLALFMTLYNFPFSVFLCPLSSLIFQHTPNLPLLALLSSMPFHLALLTPNVCMRNNISQVCCCLSAPFSLKCASKYSSQFCSGALQYHFNIINTAIAGFTFSPSYLLSVKTRTASHDMQGGESEG